MGDIYIGTSGWQYKHWEEVFYPLDLKEKNWLTFYSKYFRSVEVNSSFYRQPNKSMVIKWKNATRKDFIFSFKANRFLTHIKRLKALEGSLKHFFESFTPLLGKHVVLWQLPPSLKSDEELLISLCQKIKSRLRHAFEFRHASWINQGIFKILKKYNMAIVCQDHSGWPEVSKVITDFFYFRFHGKESLYSSKYSNSDLDKISINIKSLVERGLDVYAYFNNDAYGFAVENAKSLRKLTENLTSML